MRTTFAAISALAAVAVAAPQGVTSAIAPSTSPAAGCVDTVAGTFEIQLVVPASKRSIEKREPVVLQLNKGILTDAKGRIGSVVANGQFQFDGPPAQAGAKYTAGWALCPNGDLSLGSQTLFYQCLSGEFYNIYDHSVGAQCSAVYIQAINKSTGSAAVTQIGDGQPQASGAVTQIGDGQVQGPTGKPVTQIGDGQVQGPTGKPVTQIGDGQVQAPTGKPVTQIGDGQVQAPTGKPVTQISDGQVQAPTGRPVTQISDGQVQAPTVTPSRASNGTAPTGSTAPRPTTASPSPIAATGAAVANAVSAFGLIAGVVAVALL